MDYIHPGVGPVLSDDGEDEDKIYHAYYQWVPHMLFFQVRSLPVISTKFRDDGKRVDFGYFSLFFGTNYLVEGPDDLFWKVFRCGGY